MMTGDPLLSRRGEERISDDTGSNVLDLVSEKDVSSFLYLLLRQ